MTALVDVVREPGVYEMTNAEYHAQPALSASGMKLLIEAPALFDYQRKHPRHSDAFDFGSVWHALILGDKSAEFEIVQKQNRQKEWVDAYDYDTKSAQECRDRIVAEGKTPILAKDLRLAEAMAERFRGDPWVAEWMDLDKGAIEQSAFWEDRRTGIQLRARFDFLPIAEPGRQFRVIDPKSAKSSNPDQWLRAAADYGYHIQAALYLRAIKEMGLHPRPDFWFAIQEKRAPYIFQPIRLAPRSLAIGDHLIDVAIDKYIRCAETGHWPGYRDDELVDDLPKYYTDRFEDIAS
jgi:hypothetical protein